jgi:asparagine synthetase A
MQHTTPLAFMRGTGVNDELDGTESKKAVQFTVPNKDIPRGIKVDEKTMKEKSPYEMDCEVVQSLAKWKRIMLDRLGCQVGEGIYCDSTSIRKGYKVHIFIGKNELLQVPALGRISLICRVWFAFFREM